MSADEFTEIMEALDDLKNDTGVPRNIRLKIDDMMSELKTQGDNGMIVNRLLGELDDISNDINLQPFVRTQIFNISSMLETFN